MVTLALQSATAPLDGLRARVRGEVLTPSDAAFIEAAVIWNGAHQRHPALIVRAECTRDVVEAIRFARANALPVAVRSGGHSFAGHGSIEGGLVIDVSQMREVNIDAQRQTAWVQPGVTSRDLAPQAHALGLSLSTGDVGSVAISGLVLGGGIGWMVRSQGLTLDSLETLEVVTADGRVLLAGPDQHPELFWALRGGGGNFGVVTGMRFRLHPLPSRIVGGIVGYRATPEVFRAYLETAQAAPEDLTTQAILYPGTPSASEAAPAPTLAVFACWSGNIEDGHEVINRLRLLGDAPRYDLLREMTYPEMYELTTAGDIYGPSRVMRSAFVDEIDEELVDSLIEGTRVPSTFVQVRVLGGAMARIPEDATAFAHRARRYMVALEATRSSDAAGDAAVEAQTRTWAVLEARARGVYSNFLGDDSRARILEAYPPATYERLARVKAKYDPTNVFRSNHNIAPGPRVTRIDA